MTLLRTLSDEELIAQVEAGRDDLTTTALEIELAQRLRKSREARDAFLSKVETRVASIQEKLEFISDEITTMKEQ